MYSKEQSDIAIQLYIKYNKRSESVIRKLVYPDLRVLKRWYLGHTCIIKSTARKPHFSTERREYVGEFFLNHERNISEPVKQLSYPSRHYYQSC